MDEPASHRANEGAAEDPQADLAHRDLQPVGRSLGAVSGCGHSSKCRHGGQGDTVVEATLDIQDLTYAHRDASVGDDRLAERGVSRRQDGADQESLGN